MYTVGATSKGGSALRAERSNCGEENRASQVHSTRKGRIPRRSAKRCCARVGRNSVCMCGGRWRDSRGMGAGECHTEPAMPVGVARLILLSRSEAR